MKTKSKSLSNGTSTRTLKSTSASATRSPASNAQFPPQLQEGEPLPILELLERLYRVSCDVVSMADNEEYPSIAVGGAILETNHECWKPISRKLRKCEVLLADIINDGIQHYTCREWSNRGPAVPIFKGEASRPGGAADPGETGGAA